MSTTNRFASYASLVVLLIFLSGCGKFFSGSGGGGGGIPTTFYTAKATVLQDSISGQSTTFSVVPVPYQPVGGAFYDRIPGVTPNGTFQSFGSVPNKSYTYTGSSGTLTAYNLLLDAFWNVYYNWTTGCETNAEYLRPLPPYQMYVVRTPVRNDGKTVNIYCVTYTGGLPGYNQILPQFALNTSLPSELTTRADTPLTSDSMIFLFDSQGKTVGSSTISSVAPDGVTGTFPMPSTFSGQAFSPGFYGTALLNNSSSDASYAGGGSFLAIAANNTNYPGAFGVAGAASYTYDQSCTTPDVYNDGTCAGSTSCSYWSNESHFPIVALSSSNAVSIGGNVVQVGSSPTAVITYGTSTMGSWSGSPNGDRCSQEDFEVTTTANALVVNTGSNSVSIVDIPAGTVNATIAVGQTPVGVVVSGQYAYVVNYGSNTVSKIDLASNSVVGSASVGPSPTSIDADSAGNLWVGGSGYISELAANTFSTVSTQSISGNVTSLATSQARNRVVTTVVANTSGPPNGAIDYATANAQVQSVDLTSGAGTGSQTWAAASLGLAHVVPANVPQSLLANGTVVSPNYGNSIVVSATPGGFTVSELPSMNTILSGATPYPIRGIGTDPDIGYVYLTMPDSNSLITVPLPPVPPDMTPEYMSPL